MNELVIKTQEDLVGFANEYIKRNNIIPSKNYNVTSAMVSLYNNLLNVKDKNDKNALEVCTLPSIQNAVYECINSELTPKLNQSYFIVYGNELKCQISYFGLEKMVLERCGAKIFTGTVRDGDPIKMENRIDGSKIIFHEPNALSILQNKPIIGYYAVASDVNTGRVIDSDLMSLKEIKTSASKNKVGGQVLKEFPVEMGEKYPAKRLAKHLLNISNDSMYILVENSMGNVERVDNSNLYDYTINTEEQIKKETSKYEPAEEDVITADDLKLDDIDEPAVDIPEGAIEISYAEYKNNKEKYEMVKDSYNPSTKTVMVTVVG